MGIAIEGVVAAGRVPTWIIPAASITTPPSGSGPWSIPLTALTGATTVKTDCYMDMGDVTITTTPTTKTRQRMCQKVAQTISTGETIEVTIAAVYDQQKTLTVEVNKVYAALAKGAEVYIAQAFGHDTDVTPTSATKVDLVRAVVQSRVKTQPTAPEEDLKFLATLSGSGFWDDVSLTGA